MGRLLILNGSPRKNGLNSAIAGMISDAVKEHGYETETVNVCDLDIGCCDACNRCKTEGSCWKKDDMAAVYDKIKASDMMIIASPVYMGAETGPMKILIDRLFALERNGEHDIGSLKKTSILLTCDAEDGDMLYAAVIRRLCNVMKYLGVEDFGYGTILCGLKPEDSAASEKVKDYIDSVIFQLDL